MRTWRLALIGALLVGIGVSLWRSPSLPGTSLGAHGCRVLAMLTAMVGAAAVAATVVVAVRS